MACGAHALGDAAIERDEHRRLGAMLCLRGGETSEHIGEPARLGERRDLAGDVQDPQMPSVPAYFLNRGPADSKL